jgi:NMD protein affecting ribosome stability and mRNA decay
MKNPGTHLGRKDRAREDAERRTRSHQTPVSRVAPAPAERTLCDGCGAVFAHKTWRRSPARTMAALADGPSWGRCPACRQRATGAAGTVLLLGSSVRLAERELRRRIANVGRRARFTQPERRLVGIRRVPDGLEVLTTSQELAHRIAREVEKAFGGRARYAWSDGDGHLLARWEAPEPASLRAR